MAVPPARRREVTVADVAKKAGVGKATASRALGNYGAVSDAVRERVLAAAEELDYRPNELARSMNTGKSNTIGVIVGDIENGYFGLAMRGISDTAKAAGYDVILINTSENTDAEIDAVRVLLDKRVDALIVAPASSYVTQHLHDVYQSGRPLVLLDRRIDGLPVASALVDLAPAAHAATTLLLDEGHRRIAFVSALGTDGDGFEALPLGNSSVADRLDGIIAALGARGVSVDPALIRFHAHGLEATRDVVTGLLDSADPPTALIVSDSLIAMNTLLVLRERGVRVPDDLSLISFDDFEWAALIDPPLTVIAQPIYEVGVQAATTALRLLDVGAGTTTPQPLAAQVIRRASVAPPRALPS